MAGGGRDMYFYLFFFPAVQFETCDHSQLAKMKKSIPDMSLP